MIHGTIEAQFALQGVSTSKNGDLIMPKLPTKPKRKPRVRKIPKKGCLTKKLKRMQPTYTLAAVPVEEIAAAAVAKEKREPTFTPPPAVPAAARIETPTWPTVAWQSGPTVRYAIPKNAKLITRGRRKSIYISLFGEVNIRITGPSEAVEAAFAGTEPVEGSLLILRSSKYSRFLDSIELSIGKSCPKATWELMVHDVERLEETAPLAGFQKPLGYKIINVRPLVPITRSKCGRYFRKECAIVA